MEQINTRDKANQHPLYAFQGVFFFIPLFTPFCKDIVQLPQVL